MDRCAESADAGFRPAGSAPFHKASAASGSCSFARWSGESAGLLRHWPEDRPRPEPLHFLRRQTQGRQGLQTNHCRATGRGYDADWFRDALKDKGIKPCIPGRKSRGKPVKYDKRRQRSCHRNQITHNDPRDCCQCNPLALANGVAQNQQNGRTGDEKQSSRGGHEGEPNLKIHTIAFQRVLLTGNPQMRLIVKENSTSHQGPLRRVRTTRKRPFWERSITFPADGHGRTLPLPGTVRSAQPGTRRRPPSASGFR